MDIEKNRLKTTPKSGSGAKKGKDRVLGADDRQRTAGDFKTTETGSVDAQKTMPERDPVDYKSHWMIPD